MMHQLVIDQNFMSSALVNAQKCHETRFFMHEHKFPSYPLVLSKTGTRTTRSLLFNLVPLINQLLINFVSGAQRDANRKNTSETRLIHSQNKLLFDL